MTVALTRCSLKPHDVCWRMPGLMLHVWEGASCDCGGQFGSVWGIYLRLPLRCLGGAIWWLLQSTTYRRATGVGRLKLPGCGFESSSQRCGKHDGDVWEQKHHQRMVLARKWGQQGWGVPKQRLVCRSRLQRLRVPPVHGDLMVLPG